MANNQSAEEKVEELGSTSGPRNYILNSLYTTDNEKQKIRQNKI